MKTGKPTYLTPIQRTFHVGKGSSYCQVISLKETHPRRIESGLKLIERKGTHYTLQFSPTNLPITTHLKGCTIEGNKDNIRLFFQEINQIIKQTKENKPLAVLQYIEEGKKYTGSVLNSLTTFVRHR